jgi:hypothetical protein
MTFSVLMLIPFALVLGIGMSFAWLVSRHVKKRRGRGHSSDARGNASGSPASAGYRSLFVEQPSRWIAIRTRNLVAVQTALGLNNPTPCSWSEGINRVQDHKLFVSPPLNGWTIVVGPRLPDVSEDVDACFRFLLRLSRELGEVQFFSLNRVVGHHAWARFERGRAIRGYAWAGETLWNQGAATWAERKLGLKCYDYFELPARPHFAEQDHMRVNTERVTLLAAIWSVDPTSVDDSTLTDALGIAGDLSRARLR